ncbi:PREDICTED: uncharacterized protein LOC106808573 isoform X2 [Priapulus caudatus]|nr:PREDICTED: uncharacterized protein LOC106808573 isoform X2 [Priapulus caudatus]
MKVGQDTSWRSRVKHWWRYRKHFTEINDEIFKRLEILKAALSSEMLRLQLSESKEKLFQPSEQIRECQLKTELEQDPDIGQLVHQMDTCEKLLDKHKKGEIALRPQQIVKLEAVEHAGNRFQQKIKETLAKSPQPSRKISLREKYSGAKRLLPAATKGGSHGGPPASSDLLPSRQQVSSNDDGPCPPPPPIVEHPGFSCDDVSDFIDDDDDDDDDDDYEIVYADVASTGGGGVVLSESDFADVADALQGLTDELAQGAPQLDTELALLLADLGV